MGHHIVTSCLAKIGDKQDPIQIGACRNELRSADSSRELEGRKAAEGKARALGGEDNKRHLILEAVGNVVLEETILDALSLLGTSAAVYEYDGTCAMGIFTSNWCRYMDHNFRNDDEGNDMEVGEFLCHHRSWSGSTQLIEEAEGPVDRPCPGGLRIYAVPIMARGKIIGSINIGYGDPPQDRTILLQIAHQHHLDGEELMKAAQSYISRAPFVVEAAKSHMRASAKMIGLIVEKRFTEVEIEKNAKELSTSNRELEQFTYIASHDLKEPLRMVSNYLLLLEKRYRDKLDDEATEYIGYAVDGARRMNDMVDGLLMYSRIDRSTSPPETVDLEEELEIVTTNLEVYINDTGTNLTHDPLPQVIGDRRQIGQLFQNLISNALKFQNGHTPVVHLSAQAVGKDWTISVRDNGIGIPLNTPNGYSRYSRDCILARNIRGTEWGLRSARR